MEPATARGEESRRASDVKSYGRIHKRREGKPILMREGKFLATGSRTWFRNIVKNLRASAFRKGRTLTLLD